MQHWHHRHILQTDPPCSLPYTYNHILPGGPVKRYLPFFHFSARYLADCIFSTGICKTLILVRQALNLWVSKIIWRARTLLPVLGALAQGVGPTGVGRFANVDTGAILAILFIFAILISSTAWQAFATLAYFSPLLAITVALAPWLYSCFHHIEESSFHRFANTLDDTPDSNSNDSSTIQLPPSSV